MFFKQGSRKLSYYYSFFVAAMVAATYAYYNYTYARFHFIDFSKATFYTGDSDIFVPDQKEYILVFFSSLQESPEILISRIDKSHKATVLMVDFAQNRKKSEENVIYITAGINTLLDLISKFRIKHSPSVMIIKREKNSTYKQSTLIENL